MRREHTSLAGVLVVCCVVLLQTLGQATAAAAAKTHAYSRRLLSRRFKADMHQRKLITKHGVKACYTVWAIDSSISLWGDKNVKI